MGEIWYLLMLLFLGIYNCFDCYDKHRYREKLSELELEIDSVKEKHNFLAGLVLCHFGDTDMHKEQKHGKIQK